MADTDDGQALGGVQGISPTAPDVETTLTLIDAGVLDRLAFGTVGKSPRARVHIMRWWPEDDVPADQPLSDLGPERLRTLGLWFPWGTVGWGLCGERILIDGRRGDYIHEFDDERLCRKCRDILDDGREQRILLAYQHDLPRT